MRSEVAFFLSFFLSLLFVSESRNFLVSLPNISSQPGDVAVYLTRRRYDTVG